nr:Mpo1-like protein [Limnohabitans sp. T6-20]
MSLFRPVTPLMVQYAHYHRDRRNIATHLLGIPLIFLSIGVLLLGPSWTVAGHELTLAWCVWALTSLWYLSRGDLLLGGATVLVNGALIAVAHQVPPWTAAWGVPVWQAGLGLFAIGWVFQFVGHYFEGRKPAFVDDLVGLLVGPMFVVGELLMGVGLLPKMRRDIERQAGPSR